MSSSNSVTLQHVSKRFFKQKQRTFKEFIPALFGGKKTIESFWALKDVDFKIPEGKTIGITGHNGSGKSTLLKLIAGVTKPTKGSIQVIGKIAPLIELGAGFHPELTGRENIYLNGVILGLRRAQIRSIIDEIIDFSEIREFIDQPIKHYSSGMYLRLAFSVAVHTNPDILLVDEILAVGDRKFQKKCLAKMKEFQENGVTIIVVSHSEEMLRSFTTECILLEKGSIIARGPTEQVLAQYSKT